jgi:hypothetical protein
MESEKPPARKTSPKLLGSLGRDEMNLVEFPITLLTDRVPKEQTEAVYQDEIFDERTGRTLSRKLTITAGNHGLTTPVDDEIILALIQLTKLKNNFTNRKVEFTRHELVQLLGWSVGGAKYERIEVALDRWTSVHLKYENAWRDNRTKTWTSKEAFHIIDKYELNDTRIASDQLDLIPSYIVWGEDIFESFQAGYLKPLDYDACMGLSNSTAKRMYRFLDKRFHHKPDWTFDLKELAHEHIGLGRHYEGPAHLKRNLQPAIAELEAIDFLELMPEGERFQKNGRDWKIRLIQKAPALAPSAPPALPPAEQEPPLVAELVKRGVSTDVARKLVQESDAEVIRLQIDILDFRLAGKKAGKIDDPAAWLVAAIRHPHTPPKDYVSPAERQQAEQARQAEERQAAEDRRRQKEEEARDHAERQAADAYWTSLSADEQSRLTEEALANADAAARDTYESMKRMRAGGDGFLSMIRRDYIRQLPKNRLPENA